jgi:Domain of unknown function (DUF4166)
MALFTAFDGRLGLADSRGLAQVTWARRPTAQIARRILRLPNASAGSELTLRYSDQDISDTWTRKIGRRSIVSRCWIDGDRFIEQFGPMGVVSDVSTVGRGMSLAQTRLEFYGFRLPTWLSPTLRTRTWRAAGGTLVSATTVRGPSGRLICRSVTAMKSTAQTTSRPMSKSSPFRRIDAEVRSESRRELRLVS